VQGLQLAFHLLVIGIQAFLTLEFSIMGTAVEGTVSLTEMQAFVEHDVIKEFLGNVRVIEY
jgi:hypothetical protein